MERIGFIHSASCWTRSWKTTCGRFATIFDMTSVLDWLRGLTATSETQGDTDTVRRIVAELDKLDPDRARYLAAFAYVLSRVAGADFQITEIETMKMVELVHRLGQLTEAQAVLVVEIAKSQQRLFGGTENFLVTREFREIASEQQRSDLLRCLFAVAAADATISSEEEAQLWQIAGELGFSRAEFTGVRSEYLGAPLGPPARSNEDVLTGWRRSCSLPRRLRARIIIRQGGEEDAVDHPKPWLRYIEADKIHDRTLDTRRHERAERRRRQARETSTG